LKPVLTLGLVLALAVLVQGCDSLLEEPEPSTSVSQETALSSPDAIRGLRASMYDRFKTEDMSTDWLLGPSSLADNNSFRGNQARHQALNNNSLRAGIGTGAYNDLYGLINDANIMIAGIDEGALEPAVVDKFRAEAYFLRAMAYHHLVRIFGYDPDGSGGVVSPTSGDGAGFNLGVVIRIEPTLTPEQATDKARATVPEVYTQINEDLDRAEALFDGLPAEVRENSFFYASEASVAALRARVKLYQRQWQAADDAAASAIDLAGERFGSDLAGPDELVSIFDETASQNPEGIFVIDTDVDNASFDRTNEALATYTSNFFIAQVPTQNLMSLYEDGDARRDAWYAKCFDEVTGTADGFIGTCGQVNDDSLEFEKYASEQNPTEQADDYPHFRVAEMVLIQAEARLNTMGVGAAIQRLNDLREQRNASTLTPGAFDVDAAYDEILDERRRELAAEGHRFFDLKRLGRDIQKPLGRDALPFNSFRILDDIPTSQLGVNEELVQNPGYQD
jgi:hypothetical protein